MEQTYEIDKFISELFLLFPPPKECSAEAMQTKILRYIETLKSNKTYDYKKLMNIINLEYKYKTTPEIAWIIEKRNAECEIKQKVDKKILAVFFESGMFLDFVYCDFGLTKSQINSQLEQLYGKIKKIMLFPAGTTVMRGGEKGIFQIFPPYGEKQILNLNE